MIIPRRPEPVAIQIARPQEQARIARARGNEVRALWLEAEASHLEWELAERLEQASRVGIKSRSRS